VLGLGLQGFMMWFGFIGVHTLQGFQVPHGLDAMTSRGIFLSLPPPCFACILGTSRILGGCNTRKEFLTIKTKFYS